MKIYQHVDEFNEHDGIGNDIQGLYLLFKELGFVSSIVARINHTKSNIEIFTPSKSPFFFLDDIHVLHYGGTGYSCEFFEKIPGKKILRFHNMTPISFFKNFMTDDLFKTFDKNEIKSYLELYSLHTIVSNVLCDSVYNQSEYLRIVGKRQRPKIEVLPIIRNYPVRVESKSTGLRIGFLGRCVPNKKIEDLLFTLFYLRKINPLYTLVLIGKKNQIFASYDNMLQTLVEQLDLSGSIEIYENLSDEELHFHLSNLAIYLSMSEHEGFGIPILEAMAVGIPVLAYSSSAIVETVLNAGLLFTKKDFPLVAELIHKILTTQELKVSIIQSQINRVKVYNEFPFAEKILQIIES